MKKQNINTIYIGYDPKEHKAYEVLKFSLERISTSPLRIVTLDLHTLQNKMGVYKRKFKILYLKNIAVIKKTNF